MKYRFKLEWLDPITREFKSDVIECEDTAAVTAAEWAEDAAYSAADKGWHRVTKLGIA